MIVVDDANIIVVVGGYGAVGRTLCAELAGRFPGRVFAAGRNLGKAEAFSREMGGRVLPLRLDRKSTRLNSSHANISYAVFCLKKKHRNGKRLKPRTVHISCQC